MIWKIVNETFDSVWPMLTIFLVVVVSARVAYITQHREKIHYYQELLRLLFLVYALLMFGLLTNTELNSASGLNLRPFSEILRYDFGSKYFMYNVIGNIVIFIPFGYFISYYIGGKKLWPALIVSIITSGIVEFVQYRIGRSFDIDDIILNVAGAIFGYYIYAILRSIKKHLPGFMQKDFVYNLFCILLIGLLLFFILKRLGYGF